jgi:hypothetical protein
MRPALDAWLKLDPLQSSNAPTSPFAMPEYGVKERAAAERLASAVADSQKRAREARGFSDNYVLLTVLFASVLFFGGVARSFDSRPLRTSLAGLAIVLFLGTFVALWSLPICRE